MPIGSKDLFRKTVSFLYREIGVLKYTNHKEIFRKRITRYGFFPSQRKELAKEIYKDTKQFVDPKKILEPYKAVSGLTLEDIYIAFNEENWKNSSGGISFGGPNWVEIAKVTTELQDALLAGNNPIAQEITEYLVTLKHNNGRLVGKFYELEK